MRLLLVLIMLLALPVLVLVHRQVYFMSIQGPLLVRVSMALDTPEFAQVETSMTYTDVGLDGFVAELPLREKARETVDRIRGVRCREQDNHIRVPARLNASINGSYLSLSGWLHDEVLLRDVATWIDTTRPGLTIDTSEVEISPHVALEETPRDAKDMPRFLRNVSAAIEVPASLKVVRGKGILTVSGYVPSKKLADMITASLKEAAPGIQVDVRRLRAGAYVSPASFADERVLPAFLELFFKSPSATTFEADGKKVHVVGVVTPAIRTEWEQPLELVAKNAELVTELRVYPSLYHFPDYVPVSKISPQAVTVLRSVLNACSVSFEPGLAEPGAGEQPKLAAAAAAIAAAGPEVRILVGAHLDTVGDPKTNQAMARRRAEAVVAALTARAVPAECMEIEVFDAAPSGGDLSRRVELLVK